MKPANIFIIVILIFWSFGAGFYSISSYSIDPVSYQIPLEPNKMALIDIENRFDVYKISLESGNMNIYGLESKPNKISEFNNSITDIFNTSEGLKYFPLWLSKGSTLTVHWTVIDYNELEFLFIAQGASDYGSWKTGTGKQLFVQRLNRNDTRTFQIIEDDIYLVIFEVWSGGGSYDIEINWNDFEYETEPHANSITPSERNTAIGSMNYMLIHNVGLKEEVMITLEATFGIINQLIAYSIVFSIILIILVIYFDPRRRSRDKSKKVFSKEKVELNTKPVRRGQKLRFTTCLGCNNKNEPDSVFCMNCGTKLK